MTASATNETPKRAGRRPTGPRSRISMSWILVAGAAFALTAVLILWSLSTADQRIDVLVVTSRVNGGEPVRAGSIGTTRIAADDGYGRIYTADQLPDVVDAIAVTDLEPGDILGPALLTSKPAAGDGELLVGVRLRVGRYPAELKAGDTGFGVYTDFPITQEPIPVRIVSVTISETLEAQVTMAAPTERAAELGVWSGIDDIALIIAPLGAEP